MEKESLKISASCRFRRHFDDDNQILPIGIFVRLESSSSNLNGDFLWFQLFIEVILRMNDCEKAKQELIDRCLQQYQNDSVEKRKIKEFAENYISSEAIKWYTRDCFVYRMLNTALRQRDLDTLYAFRRLIIDIHQQLYNVHKQAKLTDPIQHYYRGQLMSREELDRFQLNVGNFISMNSFLSTSTDRQMALAFAGEGVGFSSILFDLRIEGRLNGAKPFADVKTISYYQDEEEILFMLGAIFRICRIKFNEQENLWTIELDLCSDHDSELTPSFERLKEDIDDETNLYELGRVFWKMQHLNASERCFKELVQQQHSNPHVLPGCYLMLGNLATDRGQYKEAVDYHRRSLELKQKTLPNDHPHLPYSHNSLGEALRQCGDFDEALIHHQKALDLWRQQYQGDDHENVAMCFHNIGTVFAERDEIREALKYFLQALQIMNRCLPDIHPSIARTLKNIGVASGILGLNDQALVAFEQSLAIIRKSLPSNHPELADSLRDLGTYYVNNGNLFKALNFYQQAKSILSQTLPNTHPLCIQIEQDIVEVQVALASANNVTENDN
ncbi:unnamed protein product [Rotaria socialis]|uniref:ADP ribosyltransferase domain-containing protein n=1 Tax=Rotaria socialis TaxID=392032 RepID=A0A817UXI6_9BILA|nr:unnamed protein product [Rotaria socialis]CAF3348414.1 unnamed protein product [Rotaria socialis]CAF4611403.1 unnamed protein product [Rotaria socialis]CAF4809192.1 unnamed protein product [Rotaria socialis]